VWLRITGEHVTHLYRVEDENEEYEEEKEVVEEEEEEEKTVFQCQTLPRTVLSRLHDFISNKRASQYEEGLCWP